MFTVEQIKQAHGKVRSGADFPSYIREIKALGVLFYEMYVQDGHVDYYGSQNFRTSSAANYDALSISEISNLQAFKADLQAHQEGKTDYLTFCTDCARFGILKWKVDLIKMTCTYFDINGKEVLIEAIAE